MMITCHDCGVDHDDQSECPICAPLARAYAQWRAELKRRGIKARPAHEPGRMPYKDDDAH